MTTGMHARWLVRWFCERHVEETPAAETSTEWILRAQRTQTALNAALGARVNQTDMFEVITTLEELQSVECGTHPDIDQNATLTINNMPAIREALFLRFVREVTDLLAHAEPLPRKKEKATV